MTVGMLLEEWLQELGDKVSKRTWLNRESLVRVHLVPMLGSKELGKLTHQNIHSLYRTKISEGLAASSVERIHI